MDYVKIYNNINPNICKQSVKELKSTVNWKEHYFITSDGEYVTHKTEPKTCYDILSTHDELMSIIHSGLSKYILEDINLEWFPGWSGFSTPKYNKYVNGSKMEKHCDHIQSLFTGDRLGIPILTVIGLLNDNFTGGELVLFDDFVCDITSGDLIIFPSIFLYPHKVNEVKNGNRYSFASWCW